MVDTANLYITDGMLDDESSLIDNDIGVAVTYTPVTTVNFGSDGSTRTDGTPETRYGVFIIQGQAYDLVDEGFLRNSEATFLGKATDTYTRDSKITYSTNVYRIKNVVVEEESAGNLLIQRLELIRID